MNPSNNDYWVAAPPASAPVGEIASWPSSAIGTQLANDEGLLPISPTFWDFIMTPDASLHRLILPDEARNFPSRDPGAHGPPGRHRQ